MKQGTRSSDSLLFSPSHLSPLSSILYFEDKRQPRERREYKTRRWRRGQNQVNRERTRMRTTVAMVHSHLSRYLQCHLARVRWVYSLIHHLYWPTKKKSKDIQRIETRRVRKWKRAKEKERNKWDVRLPSCPASPFSPSSTSAAIPGLSLISGRFSHASPKSLVYPVTHSSQLDKSLSPLSLSPFHLWSCNTPPLKLAMEFYSICESEKDDQPMDGGRERERAREREREKESEWERERNKK